MTEDPGNLADLRDVAMPPEIALWPPAPGIWIIAVALAAAVAIRLWRSFVVYRAAAYRRAALLELDRLAAASRRDDRSTVEEVSAVMKRAALGAFPRASVASLSGAAWIDFLVHTGGSGFRPRTIRRLVAEAYDGAAHPDAAELEGLFKEARAWVVGHAAPPGSDAG